jgi:hypothetical protein
VDLGPLIDNKYGIPAAGPVAHTAGTGLASVAAPSAHGQAAAGLVSPHNPLLAFGVLAGVTFGLMAFSTSVRVGNSSASVNLGKS